MSATTNRRPKCRQCSKDKDFVRLDKITLLDKKDLDTNKPVEITLLSVCANENCNLAGLLTLF